MIVNDLPKVAAALRERRKEAGLSQTEVAQRMGTTQSAVSDLESGAVGDPRLFTVLRYAQAVGLELHLLDEPKDQQ